MKKNLLYIAYFLEDEFSPLGIQSKRYVEGLSKFYNVTVIYRTKFSEKSNIVIQNGNYNLVPIYSKDYSLWDRRFKRFLFSLDSFFSLNEYIWSKNVLKTVNFNEFEYLIIASNPFTVQFVGLKKHKQINYISHFFDPLVDNIFVDLGVTGDFVRRKYERKIISSSRLVFVSNSLQRKTLLDRYRYLKESSIKVIPFCTDTKIRSYSVRKKNNQQLILIHAGNIYGSRNIDFIVNSLLYLGKENKELLSKIQIHFYGNVSMPCKLKVFDNKLNETIHFFPMMNHIDLYEKISKADGLILINSSVEDNLFYPSKLMEYFAFRKIILSISSKVSASNDDIINSGNLLFHFGQTEQFSKSLMNLLNDGDYYSNSMDERFWSKFTPSSVAKLINLSLNSL